MNITDQQLKQYVDNVFSKYDVDGSLTLDEDELFRFFKDLYASMNFKQKITPEDVKHSLKQIDSNHDGQVTKRELYSALKVILGNQRQGDDRKQENLPYEQIKPPKQHHQNQPQNRPQEQRKHDKQRKPETAEGYRYDDHGHKQQDQKKHDKQRKPETAEGYRYDDHGHKPQKQQVQQPPLQKKPTPKQQKINPNSMQYMPNQMMQQPMGMMGPGMIGYGDMGMGMGMPMGMGMGGMGMGMGGMMMDPYGNMGPPGMGPFGMW